MINISKKTITIITVVIIIISLIIGSFFIYQKISIDNLAKKKKQQYIEKTHQENFENENSRFDQ